jgi:hypothetical protein
MYDQQLLDTEVLLERSFAWSLGLEVQVVDFLSGYAVSGILEGFTPGEVTVSLPEMVSEHRVVEVRWNSFVFEGETLYCQPKQGRYEAHITIDDVEETGLRKVRCFPVRLAAQMFTAHAGPANITIVEISDESLGIELPAPVETGQPIAIVSGTVFVFAVMDGCREIGEGLFRACAQMQHLFERPLEALLEEPSCGIIGRVFGKRAAAKRASAR